MERQQWVIGCHSFGVFCLFLLFICLFIFSFEKGSHVAQSGLELTMWARMTLNF